MLLRWIIGDCLRRARHAQGRTLREVAEAAGVSTGYLSEVERGRKEASSEVLAAVCRALGLELLDLVGAAHGELLRWSAEAPRPLGASRPPGASRPSSPSHPRVASLATAASLRGAAVRTRGGPALAA